VYFIRFSIVIHIDLAQWLALLSFQAMNNISEPFLVTAKLIYFIMVLKLWTWKCSYKVIYIHVIPWNTCKVLLEFYDPQTLFSSDRWQSIHTENGKQHYWLTSTWNCLFRIRLKRLLGVFISSMSVYNNWTINWRLLMKFKEKIY